MQSTILFLSLLLALIAVYSAQAFTSQQVQSNNSRSTALFGKRQKFKNMFKSLFGADDSEGVPTAGKVKLSNGKAKGLAKKYEAIDCLEERTYQVLLDLKMV